MYEMSKSEQLTYSTVLIKNHLANGKISIGTGFICYLCNDGKTNIPVIFTNNHVIEGSVSIEFEFCSRNKDGTPNDLISVPVKIDNSKWIVHPNKTVDLRCMPLAPILKSLETQKKRFFIFLWTLN